ncbi:aminoacyl-tRNA deacylase [Vibrio agarivorans]|uniref:YbaK/EbsC family protein n=1 Tax=Vibrio agarivorans TaxID=153622 RepID=A0ABT7Y2S1_9VIBR|nr:YbaK/EbsC family protein [Vibrio agarivorans]MDN2482059.1 YbaK/EbsC family protein [Vibrio agarivorans]
MKNNFTTPLTSFLQQQGVAFEILHQEYETVSIQDTASARGISPQQMVKSILLRDMSERYALACIPGDQSVDPKKVRSLLNWRRMTCVQLDQLESITGYKAGTVTPLLLKRAMPIVIDTRLSELDRVTISSGDRLAGLALAPSDLLKLCQPTMGDICRSLHL